MELHSTKNRNIGLDLLRVIAMMLIIGNHWLGHGLSLKGFDTTMPHVYFLWFVRGISYTGTNLFILISSYFLCKRSFKTRHLLSLICQVLFYSISLFWITYVLGLHDISVRGVIESFFPILLGKYWFITSYVALYLLSPFLNILISRLSRHGHKCLLLFLSFFFCIIPNLLFFSPWLNWGGSCGIVWFVVLYFVGSYIREYVSIDDLKKKKAILFVWLFVFSCLPLLSKILIAFLTGSFLGHVEGSSLFFANNSILIVPLSIVLFLAFLIIEIDRKWIVSIIEFIVGSVFSVYLITENTPIRMFLWNDLVSLIDYQSFWFPVLFVLTVIGIFLICIVVDLIRRFLFLLCSNTVFPDRITKLLVPLFTSTFSNLTKTDEETYRE